LGICGLRSSGTGYGQVAISCDQGNESSSSIKVREFFDKLSDYKLLKNVSAPCN